MSSSLCLTQTIPAPQAARRASAADMGFAGAVWATEPTSAKYVRHMNAPAARGGPS